MISIYIYIHIYIYTYIYIIHYSLYIIHYPLYIMHIYTHHIICISHINNHNHTYSEGGPKSPGACSSCRTSTAVTTEEGCLPNGRGPRWRYFFEDPGRYSYNVGPSSYVCWFTKPMKTIVICVSYKP